MITKEQFKFLLAFAEQSTSGPKYSESRIDAAEKYIFDREAWKVITASKNGRYDITKSYGKKLAEKILYWHEFFTDWPSDVEGRFELLKTTGGRPMKGSVINATIQHAKTGENVHSCAIANGCFHQSVKSALAKIEKFDDAAKRYGDL